MIRKIEEGKSECILLKIQFLFEDKLMNGYLYCDKGSDTFGNKFWFNIENSMSKTIIAGITLRSRNISDQIKNFLYKENIGVRKIKYLYNPLDLDI